MRPATALALLAALVVGMAARTLAACSCTLLVGPGVFFLGDGGRLPADAGGIPWWADGLEGMTPADSSRVTLERLDAAGHATPEPFTLVAGVGLGVLAPPVLIAPANGMRPGDRFRVRARELEVESRTALRRVRPARWPAAPHEAAAVVTVVDPAPRSDVPLHVAAGRVRSETLARGLLANCGAHVFPARVVRLDVVLPPALAGLRGYFLYSVELDGAVWQDDDFGCDVLPPPGRAPPLPAGALTLFEMCGRQGEGWRPGAVRRARVVARSPDGRVALRSPLFELDLRCPAGATAPRR